MEIFDNICYILIIGLLLFCIYNHVIIRAHDSSIESSKVQSGYLIEFCSVSKIIFINFVTQTHIFSKV